MKDFKIFNIIFVLALVLPTLLYMPFKDKLGKINNENRELAQKPELTLSTIADYPSAFEEYYNDHLPFRNILININADFKYYVLRTVSNDTVIAGKDDWLFYKTTVEDFEGTNKYTSSVREYMIKRLKWFNKIYKSKGTDFAVLIIPNKNTVYPEYMKDYYRPSVNHRINNLLVDFQQEAPELNVIYPYEDIMNGKSFGSMYYHGDTHCTKVAGYIIANSLFKATGDTTRELQQSDITTNEVRPVNDLKRMLNLSDLTEPDTSIADWSVIEPSKKYKKVFYLGDSFMYILKYPLDQKYGDVTYAHWDDFDENTLNVDDYDLVIVETVERLADRFMLM